MTVLVETAAERLKRLRIAAGYRSARAFAEAVGVSPVTYHHHENGRRGMPRDVAALYAEKLNVPAGQLLYGETSQTARSARVVGSITAKGTVKLGEADEITLPQDVDPIGVVALVVDTEELWPAYRPGDHVYYRPTERTAPARDCNGRDCVVTLADGSTVLRMFMFAGAGKANLMAFSGPPMLNVEYITAFPVISILRG